MSPLPQREVSETERAHQIDLQTELVAAILQPDSTSQFDEKHLAPYRHSLIGNAAQALAVSFPTVQALVGTDSFTALAAQYLQYDPPTVGDWGVWGARLPELLGRVSAINTYPFLPDVAQLDWACHQAERSENRALRVDTLSLLEQPSEAITLELGMGLAIINSEHPIVDFWHKQQIKTQITEQAPAQTALIWRQHWKAQVITLSEAEALWYKALLQGQSLSSCLSEIAEIAFSFEDWLPEAITQGWVLGVNQIP